MSDLNVQAYLRALVEPLPVVQVCMYIVKKNGCQQSNQSQGEETVRSRWGEIFYSRGIPLARAEKR